MSVCPGCGRPYNQTPVHVIDTVPDRGLVAYCKSCDQRLTLGEKKSYITDVINRWKRAEKRRDHDTSWQIALDTADWEHSQRWRGHPVR